MDLKLDSTADNAALPWTATGDHWTLVWSPTAPHLTGSGPSWQTVIVELEDVLARADTIRLTPTSAAVESTTREPAAVLAALGLCGRPFSLTGSSPSFESVEGLVYAPPVV